MAEGMGGEKSASPREAMKELLDVFLRRGVNIAVLMIISAIGVDEFHDQEDMARLTSSEQMLEELDDRLDLVEFHLDHETERPEDLPVGACYCYNDKALNTLLMEMYVDETREGERLPLREVIEVTVCRMGPECDDDAKFRCEHSLGSDWICGAF